MSKDTFRRPAAGLLIGYGIQFLVGMTLNLFIKLPDTHPGRTGNEYFIRSGHSLLWALSGGGGVALAIHVYIAVALLAGATVLFMRGIRMRSRSWMWCGGLAAFFTLAALFNGLSFVNYGEDFSSMIMATCWLGAVVSLMVGLVMSYQKR